MYCDFFFKKKYLKKNILWYSVLSNFQFFKVCRQIYGCMYVMVLEHLKWIIKVKNTMTKNERIKRTNTETNSTITTKLDKP